jgi:hypothetical protein
MTGRRHRVLPTQYQVSTKYIKLSILAEGTALLAQVLGHSDRPIYRQKD